MMNHRIAYNLSNDYKRAYQLLRQGYVIAGFVDYKDKIGICKRILFSKLLPKLIIQKFILEN